MGSGMQKLEIKRNVKQKASLAVEYKMKQAKG